jgi:hypothetical protein
MRRIALLALGFGLLVPFLASAPAHAQASRTWVSGVGDDANPCSRTAPCKTFAGAISKTAAAGEINCLDPGGFGGVTITKSITLNCHEVFGSILVAGSNGILIAAAATDRVVLRNLQIQGLLGTNNPGTNGIRISSAAVVSIEDCVITQFSLQGISDARTNANGKLFIKNTTVSHNTGNGIATGAAAPHSVTIENTTVVNSSTGAAFGNGTLAMISRSNFSGNSVGVEADPGGGANIDSTVISGNTSIGIQGNNNIRISNTDVTFNATGFSGTTVSYQNNRLQGNTTFGTPVGTTGLQ